MDETDYEIVYQLRRRRPGEEDYSEIGFGATAGWDSPEQCADMVLADVQNYQWETEDGQPDPDTIRAELGR